ncbi:MAG: DnaJ domain-containing protein [Burkholderiales bacterium]|nr:DnaJ domain-containing protein [Burkholderiales bacterium]
MTRSLYDILELSAAAGPDAIRASYERLSAKLDPDAPHNAGNPQVRMQYEAVKEAFLTLADPARRARYDAASTVRPTAYDSTDVSPGFWTLPKVALLVLALLAGGGWYAQHKNAEAKLAAERAIAEAKAKEAEAKARAEAEAAAAARVQAQRERELERQRASQEARTRNEFERSRREFDRERQQREYSERMSQERQSRNEQNEARRREYERQRADAANINDARRRAAREREELCRMERARYGHAISC